MESPYTTDQYSPKWILALKSTIRPFLTYLFTGLYVYVFIHRYNVDTAYINGLNTIMITIIIFWFGERLLRNTGIADYITALSKSNLMKDTKQTKKEKTEDASEE